MSPEQRYPHLSPVAAQVADMDDETRIAYLAKDRFVPHSRADQILDEFERLMSIDDAVRPQGRLLVGHSLMGKTTLVDEFLKRHPPSDNPDGDAASVPVLKIEMPEQAKEGVYFEILSTLNAKLPRGAKPNEIRGGAVHVLQLVGLRILFIDEFHNVLEGTAPAQRKCLNAIKYLMNYLRRPVVVVGTGDVINAIQSDLQISSRLRPTILSRFKDDEYFQDLLVGFEALLPLRKASNLADPELSTLIYRHSLGILGDVSDLLNDAAAIAIRDGTEQITENEINAFKNRSDENPRTLIQMLG